MRTFPEGHQRVCGRRGRKDSSLKIVCPVHVHSSKKVLRNSQLSKEAHLTCKNRPLRNTTTRLDENYAEPSVRQRGIWFPLLAVPQGTQRPSREKGRKIAFQREQRPSSSPLSSHQAMSARKSFSRDLISPTLPRCIWTADFDYILRFS